MAHHRGRYHSVRFYEDDPSLCRIVSDFLGDGLAAGQPAVVIATAAHKEGIIAGLAALSFDVAGLQESEELLFLDAEQTLSMLMKDGMPDPDAFERHIGRVVDRMIPRRPQPQIRAYGEMVDVLWKQGAAAAAIRLEVLWNQLAETRAFSLLCAYSMGNFYKQGAYEDICRQHTHVVSSGGHSVPVLVE